MGKEKTDTVLCALAHPLFTKLNQVGITNQAFHKG
jgi:hypothetical protein